jgi:hypothetical protein
VINTARVITLCDLEKTPPVRARGEDRHRQGSALAAQKDGLASNILLAVRS